MHILIIGQGEEAQAVAMHLPAGATPAIVAEPPADLSAFDIIFHPHADESAGGLHPFLGLKDKIVVASCVYTTLAEQVNQALRIGQTLDCHLFGYNAWPDFVSAPLWEVVSYKDSERELLTERLSELSIDTEWVADQVGLVRPRILSMIINEAYFMMGEQAADALAIDQALKLGVNYPDGPVVWGQRIGLHRIAKLLTRMGQLLGSDTYHPSPALASAVWRLSVSS